MVLHLTDQPGRVFAVVIFGPLLIYKGYKYKDIILIALGLVLILWDLYWLVFKDPCKSVTHKK